MSTDNKTLADVQPGGRVRLKDALPPLPPEVDAVRCMIRGEKDLAEACDYYYTAEQMRDYARAALSAQPSPGGQDALTALVAKWRAAAAEHELNGLEADSIGLTVAAMRNDARHHVLEAAADELEAALAARQPVESEKNVAADTYWTLAEMIEPHVQREGINPDGVLPASVHDSVAILLEHWLRTRQPVGENPAWRDELVREAYNRGLADGLNADRQPVGEPVDAIERIARLLYLRSCNRHADGSPYTEWEPMDDRIKDYYRKDAQDYEALRNCALWPAGRENYTAPPAQAVDLGQFREAVLCWRREQWSRTTYVPDAESSPGDNVERADRLLALIDGKAVGK